MSTSIYNLTHPQRSGFIRLAPSGHELFGTVIRQGKMDKTVTVSMTMRMNRLNYPQRVYPVR